jgi:rod shape-determining protein MreD
MQRYILPIVMLILAGALQGNVPFWLTFKGVRPDFLLVVLVSTSLTLDPLAGGVIGFMAGCIHGTIAGSSLGSFIVSRTIIGFLSGLVTVRFFSDNPLVPVIAAGGLTFLGEAVFLLASPVPDLTAVLNTVLIKSLCNSFLTLIVFWVLRWVEVHRKIKKAEARL